MHLVYTRLFSAVALLCLHCSLFAQGQVSGQLITDDGQAAEYSNVLLMAPADSSVIKMELSELDGSYLFKDIAAGEYFIKVMGISIEDYHTESFTLEEGEEKVVPLIRLNVSSQTLDEVEVVARKPLLEQRAGRLVVNVENNITGQAGSVTDLLKKVPGVIVVNNRVQMAGKSGVTILIDGRPTKYMDVESLLKDMPADNIAKIEVITQPGAAYDAEGTGGVINIVLKKNSLLGTNGQISLGTGYGELWKFRSNASINHREGPWNLTASGGYNNRTWVERLYLERVLPDRSYVQETYTPGDPRSVYLRLGADYDINPNHRVGLTVNSSRSNNDRIGANETVVMSSEGVELERFKTDNIQDRFWRSYTADAFYRWEIDTAGQQLTMDLNYANYRRDVTSDLITVGADFEDRRNEEPADTRIYAGQIDYKLPIGQQWQFQAGTKVSVTELDNELKASLRPNGGGEWVNDVLRTNTFLYDEKIYAGYVNLFYSKDAWEANLGLRYEDSQATGYSATLDSTINLNIQQLFPSVSVSTPFVGPLTLNLAYSYRIERPGYFDLNPFLSYLDPLTFQKGNPFLRPELTHSGELSLAYEGQPFFSLSYDRTNDVLTEVIEQDDETGEAFQTDINLDKYTRYGGRLFFPLDFIAKPISGYGGVMMFYHDYQSQYLEAELVQDQFTVTGFMQVNVALPHDWKLEVTGWLQGAGLDGLIRYETFYGVDAGLQKEFFNDQLRIQLSADGIVQKFFQGTIEYQNLDFNILSEWEAPTVSARVTWKFGNRYLKNRENRRSSSAAERQRAQGE